MVEQLIRNQQVRGSNPRAGSSFPEIERENVYLLEEKETRSVREVLSALLVQGAVEPHLRTTLRKMGQGQKCSLRFFPEGPILRATGTVVRAGFSGDRLTNVLGMLADLGFCLRQDNGYGLTDKGREFLRGVAA